MPLRVPTQEPLTVDLIEFPEKQKLNWPTTLVLLLLHVGTVAALFTFSWANLAVTLFFLWFATGLGISMGYHRLHTHRSYQVPLALEYLFAVCGTLTFEGGPIFWVATHRIHHQKSDMPGDPHSPRDGGWWAHVGWILVGEAKHNNTRLMSKYAPDLAKHRFYVWLNNYHWLPNVLLAGLLFAIGGLPMVLWGVCLRVTVGLHATWLVNSATHMWGSRRFETRDDSRNSWWVAMITFGEGWHNNHHAHPTSARHGLAWYEFDLSWIQIQMLRILGIARRVKVAKISSPVAERDAA
ncbi:MAG TPA: fatty acid desaturase [Bryobacteraceae bacterium]|nr:fatty acid desaturase [Bryobacteraceae bacterium]